MDTLKLSQMSALAMALAAGLVACATTTTTGRMPNATLVAQVKTGMTIDEVRAVLGKPFQTLRNSDGLTTLSYVQTAVNQHSPFSTSADVDSKTLVLFFDREGRLVRFAHGKNDTLSASAQSG